MRLRRLVLTTALSIVVMLGVVSYANADCSADCSGCNWYVDRNSSGGNGTSWATAFQKIGDAIAAAKGAGGAQKICVRGGPYSNENFPLKIDFNNLTLIGCTRQYYGPKIQGDGANRVIEVISASNVTIKNFLITNGSSAGDGGGILVDHSHDVYLCDLEVHYNHCAGNGGGMAWKDSSGLIDQNCIWENTAGNGGGGIYFQHAWDGQNGGALAIWLQDSCIFWNEAETYGGGIYLDDFGDDWVEIFNNLIRQNCIYGSDYSEKDNWGLNQSAGIQGSHCAKAYIKSNTVADNFHCNHSKPKWGSPDDGYVWGIKWGNGGWMRAIHNIVYFNGTSNMDDVNQNAAITILYSDIYLSGGGTYPGTGNMNSNPLFTGKEDGQRPCNSTFYFLSLNSPCVDAGIPANSDEWGQDHCKLVNTQSCGKTPLYSVHRDGREDLDGWCNSGGCGSASESNRIDLGYHYKHHGMNYIQLVSFSAEPIGRGMIVVRWETATEIDNAGFLLYRCDSAGGEFRKLGDFIPASGSVASGASYSFTDTNVKQGFAYYYYLVDVDTGGRWTAHGPVSARVPVQLDKIIIAPRPDHTGAIR